MSRLAEDAHRDTSCTFNEDYVASLHRNRSVERIIRSHGSASTIQ